MKDTWHFSTIHDCVCKVIEEKDLWGQKVCYVWLPDQDKVVRVPVSALHPVDVAHQPDIEAWRIAYVSAAAKVAEVLEGSSRSSDGSVLLAPMESNVIPLPHQIQALSRSISGDRVRYLLADEVGLGKTIEAGLIMRELKLRGLVRRTLVVSPKGLATQWVSEMQTHFNEDFQLILGEDISTLQRVLPVSQRRETVWSMFDQVIVSLDSVKPVDKRRGWSAERLAEYNQDRFEDLVTAGWDLVVVDEAHRLGGSTDQVARYKLGQGLAEAAPYMLLLSATPHQGKTDAFHRLISLLDEEAFPDIESVSHERVAPYVIRTEKRKAIDDEGRPLFKPRHTVMAPVRWEENHRLQQLLYEVVTEYVREGYNQALRDKKRHIGFLMILMQRLVVSSTRAIHTTLQRRLAVLKESEARVTDRLSKLDDPLESSDTLDEFYDMDGQELLDKLLSTEVSAIRNEVSQVEGLLDVANKCEQAGPDAKTEALIGWIYELQKEENDPDLKILIFTEFVPTQEMLRAFLESRGISVVVLNGSMDIEQRKKSQDDFSNQARILISTDAGGEGLNLQFCHVVINYDIPWNPMRLEQRIGRVDRIGQPKTVRAINFVFEDSVEFRVREVLEQKLAVIFEEFGIDKTGDVLDSAQAGEIFEEVFTSAILNPDSIESSAEQTVSKVRQEMIHVRESSAIYGISEEPDVESAERFRSHPLPHWIERMTVGYLNVQGGQAKQNRSWWDLTWPDGQEQHKCVFNVRDAARLTDATLLNLENKQIRDLALKLPHITEGQVVPCVALKELPDTISGLWGLFEIQISAGADDQSFIRIPQRRRGYISVFLSDEGKLFLPTARYIWDTIQTSEPQVLDTLSEEDARSVFDQLMVGAEEVGREMYDALKQMHLTSVKQETERGEVAFAARRKAIAHVGLPEVRQYREAKCDAEEAAWRKELAKVQELLPEVRPLLMMRIMPRGLG